MKFLGIDYGLSKIGLAIGDGEVNVAAPLEVIKNDQTIFDRLKEMVRIEGIDEIVIGMPTQFQGEVTKKFVQDLSSMINIPVHTVDESYSSVESQRIQGETGSNVEEDALAAMLILQSFFDESRD